MSRALDKKIQDLLDLTLPAAKKELNFIKGQNWSVIDNLEKREIKYNIQHKLNDRNLNVLIKLYHLSIEDLYHPDVKKAIKIFLEFYYLLDERYAVVDKKYDWTKFDQEEKNVEAKMEAELSFQTEVLKNLTTFRERLRKINFGEESTALDIPIHSDKPVPITMCDSIEARYPEVREHIESRKKDRDGV
jgi:hypothetical protein